MENTVSFPRLSEPFLNYCKVGSFVWNTLIFSTDYRNHETVSGDDNMKSAKLNLPKASPADKGAQALVSKVLLFSEISKIFERFGSSGRRCS